ASTMSTATVGVAMAAALRGWLRAVSATMTGSFFLAMAGVLFAMVILLAVAVVLRAMVVFLRMGVAVLVGLGCRLAMLVELGLHGGRAGNEHVGERAFGEN